MTPVTRIHFQSIPATDPERARDFYRGVLGLTVERDMPYGETRWIFMALPGGDTLLHFAKVAEVPKTETPGLVLVSPDVDATCEALRGKGVTITAGPDDAPWEPSTRWALFNDSEGNIVLIQTVKEADDG